jgi:hypothetical protein
MHGLMAYRITAEADYLRGELSGRETVEETQAFLGALVRERIRHACSCVLILVRRSTPVFQVAAHRLIESFEELSGQQACRIALVGDTRDLHMSHEYIELLARQLGLNVRSYRDERSALQWFGNQRPAGERRQRHDQRLQDRRNTRERRQGSRREEREERGRNRNEGMLP